MCKISPSIICAEAVETAITGIPASLRKNVFKALGQLLFVSVDIPVAYLESKATEIRDNTKARSSIIATIGKQIETDLSLDSNYGKIAAKKYAEKILREQSNVNSIVNYAMKELSEDPPLSFATPNASEISSDWLNLFEREASLKDSEEAKILFGKILAGEIKAPSSFSIRTIKLLSQLDNEAARIFQKFCSCAIGIKYDKKWIDIRVVSFGNAGSNSLSEFGLNFDRLNLLNEYGLVISDYNSWLDYMPSVIANNEIAAPLYFQGQEYGLQSETPIATPVSFKIHGVALSTAGKELFDIVSICETQNYFNKLQDFFKQNKYRLIGIKGG